MSSFDRFEAPLSRAAHEDYGDAAAILAARIAINVEVPEILKPFFSEEDISEALNAARETLKYRLSSRTFNRDCRNGTHDGYVELDTIVMKVIK